MGETEGSRMFLAMDTKTEGNPIFIFDYEDPVLFPVADSFDEFLKKLTNVDTDFEERFTPEDKNKINGNSKKITSDILKKYSSVGEFFFGVALVEKDGKFGYLNLDGKEITPIEWDEAESFEEGFGRVRKGKYWGLMDVSGKMVLKPEYDSLILWDGKTLTFSTINQKGRLAEFEVSLRRDPVKIGTENLIKGHKIKKAPVHSDFL